MSDFRGSPGGRGGYGNGGGGSPFRGGGASGGYDSDGGAGGGYRGGRGGFGSPRGGGRQDYRSPTGGSSFGSPRGGRGGYGSPGGSPRGGHPDMTMPATSQLALLEKDNVLMKVDLHQKWSSLSPKDRIKPINAMGLVVCKLADVRQNLVGTVVAFSGYTAEPLLHCIFVAKKAMYLALPLGFGKWP